jgi:RluA family pseudouridine synthase
MGNPANGPALRLVYEDEHLLVVDKPGGLLSMASDSEDRRTAFAQAMQHVRKGNPRSRARVFIVHRLDRETSGLLVLARSEELKRALQADWATVRKSYLALVHGRPKEDRGEIATQLLEGKDLSVRVVSSGGYWSETAFCLRRAAGRHSMLEVHISTGRKHQIRVHLAHLGLPVVGDRRYGLAGDREKRLGLHAAELEFTHPVLGKRLRFSTPAPGWFGQYLHEPRIDGPGQG